MAWHKGDDGDDVYIYTYMYDCAYTLSASWQEGDQGDDAYTSDKCSLVLWFFFYYKYMYYHLVRMYV